MPNVKLEGLKAMRAAFKALPEVTRDRLNEATEKTAFSLLQRALALVPVLTGALKSKLNWTISRTTGIAKVGIEKGLVGDENPALYGHLVEFGHAGPHPAPAHPFMIPAAEAEREPYLDRCRDAGKNVERDMATIGGGLL
jgi:HK97 gp10 family phage protein